MQVDEIGRALWKHKETDGNDQSRYFFQKNRVTKLEIQGQLRANRPYLKSIALNAQTQRLQVALLVEVHFSLRYRTDNPGNTLILSSPTQKAASHWGHPVAILESNRGELREAYVEYRYGNPEPSPSNGLKVDGKVQRLKGEEARLISPYQRPALAMRVDKIVRAVRKLTDNKSDMSNGFSNKVRQAVTLGCYRVNSGEAYSEGQGNPEPSRTNGLRVIRKVQRSEGADAKPINLQQRPALALAA